MEVQREKAVPVFGPSHKMGNREQAHHRQYIFPQPPPSTDVSKAKCSDIHSNITPWYGLLGQIFQNSAALPGNCHVEFTGTISIIIHMWILPRVANSRLLKKLSIYTNTIFIPHPPPPPPPCEIHQAHEAKIGVAVSNGYKNDPSKCNCTASCNTLDLHLQLQHIRSAPPAATHQICTSSCNTLDLHLQLQHIRSAPPAATHQICTSSYNTSDLHLHL